MDSSQSASSLPPEAIALAGRMYDAARKGDLAIFQQALPAGLPANMTNEKGDTLVLLEGGADPDFGSPSALQCVAMFKQEDKWQARFESAPGRGKVVPES
ncbi:hypothetical protein CCUS01_15719 [Colletotrichum cuscutae]|uniref:Uncharacterized protein n=1 Tax=Colletotrichum cuscutae TaxID=1209917 RepID=A0AAI9VE33_9PEZI|nr:hypothetical protein CCUS01_15719 [Colletotrichum cuscutae]